eukprot:tig00020554_g10847.t1
MALETREVADLGSVAVANRDYAPGDLILEEKPLLVWPNEAQNGQLHKTLYDLVGDQLPTDFVNLLVAYLFAPEDVQKKIEDFTRPPDDAEDPAIHMFRDCATKVQKTKKFRDHSVNQLFHLMLAAAVNAHLYKENLSALFEHGSKVIHSCTPNADYRGDDSLLYRAIKPIKKGEVISFCYIDFLPACASQPIRHDFLMRTKYFTCRCKRCTGADKCRMMRCPVAECKKRVVRTGRNGDGAPEDKPWKCEACGKVFADSEMPLVPEEQIMTAVMTMDTYTDHVGQKQIVYVMKMAMQMLGEDHWTVAWLNRLFAEFYQCAWSLEADGSRAKDVFLQLSGRHALKFLTWINEHCYEEVPNLVANLGSMFVRYLREANMHDEAKQLYEKYMPMLRLLWGESDPDVKEIIAYQKGEVYVPDPAPAIEAAPAAAAAAAPAPLANGTAHETPADVHAAVAASVQASKSKKKGKK